MLRAVSLISEAGIWCCIQVRIRTVLYLRSNLQIYKIVDRLQPMRPPLGGVELGRSNRYLLKSRLKAIAIGFPFCLYDISIEFFDEELQIHCELRWRFVA